MRKRKTYQPSKKKQKVNEPLATYKSKGIRIFNSFEEQAEYELQQMAVLSPEQILKQLRQFINIAYGMHGYDPENLPKKHFVKIITR